MHIFLLFCLYCRTSQNLCIQISSTPSGTSLSLIFFTKKLITPKTVTSKETQATHVNKGDGNIVITQSTHNTCMGPMTRSKAKSTTTPSTKLASKHTHLLKSVGTCKQLPTAHHFSFFGGKRSKSSWLGKIPFNTKGLWGWTPLLCCQCQLQHQLTLRITNWDVERG